MYDFQAERADELEAKAGEAIIVIAQSNPEWFVAKPIGRLGGPGLIPVSFIEIRDMASNTPVANPQDAIKRAGIPRVEEWKKMTADYKNSSITLGKFDNGSGPPSQGIEQGMERMSLQQGNGRMSQGNGRPVSKPVHFLRSRSCCKGDKLTDSFFSCSNPARILNLQINRNSQTLRHHSTHPFLRGYPDTALPRTSIGLSLRPRWRTDGTGSFRDTTKTFTISKLRS